MELKRIVGGFLLGVACYGQLQAAAASNSTALPEIIAADPELMNYAKSHGIAMDGIGLSATRSRAEAGDTVTALVTLRDAGTTKQWLVTLLVAVPTPAETAAHPPTDSRLEMAGQPYTYHAGDLRALEIKTIGPLVVGKSSALREERARALISGDLLALGLDRGCRLLAKSTSSEPAAIRAQTLSSEDARLVGGMVIALIEFVQDVQSTPGLREILWDVMEKPSVWSFVKSGGKTKLDIALGESAGDTALIKAGEWPTVDRTLYRLGLMLAVNGKPALQIGLVVGPPESPLTTTAGIRGLVALAPTLRTRRMDLQIVAAHTGNAADRP